MRAGTQRYASRLAYDETHVYLARVSSFASFERECVGRLDDDELERARRFRRSCDRSQYVTAHGLLREILGAYLNVGARDVRFEHDALGKPHPVTTGTMPISCSLSHARDLVAIAVTAGRAVGIDVETVTRDDIESIATLCFTASERRAIAELSADARNLAYFTTWTRKEAYVKALGIGIGDRLQTFDVAVAPRSAALLSDSQDPRACVRWILRDIGVPPDYVGAIVDATPSSRVRQIRMCGMQDVEQADPTGECS